MDARVRKVMTLIQKERSRDSSLDEIASQLNLSSSRLRHLFKEETGTTIVQYRKTIRLLQAKRLLETTFLSVKEIMLKVGCRDESNFVRDFKRKYGLSPKRYRESYLRGMSRKKV